MSGKIDRDILIVGGGLAGLGLAGYLAKHDQQPLVVEQAAEWTDSGYGIGLWEDGLRALSELKVLDDARTRAADPSSFQVRAPDGEVLTEASMPSGETLLLAIHRADLHVALREAVPSDWIRMDTTPTHIEERSDDVVVTFDDGTTKTFDLVVGADGVHSTVRETCFDAWEKHVFDTYVWSLWADQDRGLGHDMVSVWGPGSEGFVARVGERVVFNLAARLDTAPSAPGRETLRARAKEIGWELPAILDKADETPFFDRVRDVSVEQWHTDRVVLIGDAAHAVHPISGMGASLALQDARVLAEELATAGSSHLGEALAAFESRRHPAAMRVRREARFEAGVTMLRSPRLRWLRNRLVEYTPAFEWFISRQMTDSQQRINA